MEVIESVIPRDPFIRAIMSALGLILVSFSSSEVSTGTVALCVVTPTPKSNWCRCPSQLRKPVSHFFHFSHFSYLQICVPANLKPLHNLLLLPFPCLWSHQMDPTGVPSQPNIPFLSPLLLHLATDMAHIRQGHWILLYMFAVFLLCLFESLPSPQPSFLGLDLAVTKGFFPAWNSCPTSYCLKVVSYN